MPKCRLFYQSIVPEQGIFHPLFVLTMHWHGFHLLQGIISKGGGFVAQSQLSFADLGFKPHHDQEGFISIRIDH